jgi:hypothetical protein
MEEKRDVNRILVENLREGGHLKSPGVDGRVILKWIFEKWKSKHRKNRCVSGQRHVVGCCGCGNEISGSIKWWEFLEWLRNCQLLKKDSIHVVF